MFKRILIPTDGSDLSQHAVAEGVGLARALNATVVGFYAPEDYKGFLVNEYMPPALLTETEYEENLRERVDATLASIARAARSAGVPYEPFSVPATTPWPAIIEAARQKACDLIFMASHARTGLIGRVRGSQASEVMSHSEIPVLVWREPRRPPGEERRSPPGRVRPQGDINAKSWTAPHSAG